MTREERKRRAGELHQQPGWNMLRIARELGVSFATIQRDLAGERAKSSPKRKCHPRCDNGRIAHRSLPGWFKRCEGCNSPDLGRAAHRLARGLGLNCQTLDCGYALFIPNRAPMTRRPRNRSLTCARSTRTPER